MRSGLPPEEAQHPLMSHQFEAAAKESVKPRPSLEDGVSPLTASHGTHGWAVVFDLNSRQSYEQSKAMVEALLDRVEYDRRSKRQCPVTILLVGNKYDMTQGGKRSAVSQKELLEFVAAHCLEGALMQQLRKQKLDRALYKLIDKLVTTRKALATTWSTGAEKVSDNDEDGGVVVFSNQDPKANDVQSNVPETLGGLTHAQFNALSKLRAEFDPLRVSGTSPTDLEVLTGFYAAIEHPAAQKLEEPSAEDLHEALLACPALAVKYVEVSCRTNYQMHTLERVLLRSLRLLPRDLGRGARGKNKGKPGVGPGNLLQSMQTGFSDLLKAPAWCMERLAFATKESKA